jgi:hypothetical protein
MLLKSIFDPRLATRLGESSNPVNHAMKRSAISSRRTLTAGYTQSRRYSHQTTSTEQVTSRSKLSPFFTLLLCAGLGAVAYGVYVPRTRISHLFRSLNAYSVQLRYIRHTNIVASRGTWRPTRWPRSKVQGRSRAERAVSAKVRPRIIF